MTDALSQLLRSTVVADVTLRSIAPEHLDALRTLLATLGESHDHINNVFNLVSREWAAHARLNELSIDQALLHPGIRPRNAAFQAQIDLAALQKLQLKPQGVVTDLETTKHTRLLAIAFAAIEKLSKMGFVAQEAASSRGAAYKVKSEFECVREGKLFRGKWLFAELEVMHRPLLALERLRDRTPIAPGEYLLFSEPPGEAVVLSSEAYSQILESAL